MMFASNVASYPVMRAFLKPKDIELCCGSKVSRAKRPLLNLAWVIYFSMKKLFIVLGLHRV